MTKKMVFDVKFDVQGCCTPLRGLGQSFNIKDVYYQKRFGRDTIMVDLHIDDEVDITDVVHIQHLQV